MARIKARLSMSLSVNQRERRIIQQGLNAQLFDGRDEVVRMQLIQQFEHMDRLEGSFLNELDDLNKHVGR